MNKRRKLTPEEKAAIESTLTTAPDQTFDPADEDLDIVVEGSDPYEIDGEVQTCINCEEHLTVEDMKEDLARCKTNEWEEPTEFVCQKRACKEFRKSISGRQAEDRALDDDVPPFVVGTKRRTEDGTVKDEPPLCDVIFLTKHELGEEGVPKREERTDHEIHTDLISRVDLPPRCAVHGTPGCFTCNVTAALIKHYNEHPEERTNNGLPKAAPKGLMADSTGVPRQKSLEAEVAEILKKKQLDKLAKNPPKKDVDLRREKEIKRTKKLYDKYSLRRLHGYSPRQLAALFDSPRFNPKSQALFTLGQRDYYKDYATGKISVEILAQRVADGWYGRKGFERPDYLKRLEDAMVNRAWVAGLLEPTKIVVPDGREDEDWWTPDETENQVIGRGGSDMSIIGSKWKDTSGKTFIRRPLDSFEQGYITKRTPWGSGGDSGGGSDYGESSDDESL